jgi:TatD DNase family protein
MLDSHCHLAGEEFVADLTEVAARAAAAGIRDALCILESEEADELARAEAVRGAWPSMRFATGIHPHHAGRFADDIPRAIETVRAAVTAARACAIGEIGLDYHYDFSPRAVQHALFAAQIRLARELGLPIIIHTREATEDTFRIIREAGEGQVRGVFHCFTGDRAMAEEALELDFYVSFAGILTFPKAEALRDAARAVPLDRILSETDAPYLAPVPHRGTRNEPAFVVRVVETLAELHGQSRETMAAGIHENFVRLFGPAAAGGQAP